MSELHDKARALLVLRDKATPGPWFMNGGVKLVGDAYSRSGQHALYCADVRVDGLFGSVCSIQSADHVDDGISREQAAANSQLIASAPDLLSALQSLLAAVDSDRVTGDELDAARTTIANATGTHTP